MATTLMPGSIAMREVSSVFSSVICLVRDREIFESRTRHNHDSRSRDEKMKLLIDDSIIMMSDTQHKTVKIFLIDDDMLPTIILKTLRGANTIPTIHVKVSAQVFHNNNNNRLSRHPCLELVDVKEHQST